MKRKWMLAYGCFFFALCLIPVAGMVLPEKEASSENRTLAKWPALQDENGWNWNYLSEAGDYFQDHFGFRQELVTANALLQGKLFGVSAADGVICGTDGWLYYKDSLDDYLGTNLMSDRQLYNAARTLALMQEYVEKRGAKFLFTVAPNKNTLYGEWMPYYDKLVVTEENNIRRMQTWLEKEGVSYLNLTQALEESDEILYHKKDSHWNNMGAAIASDALMTALEKEHESYEDVPYEEREDFTGDLDQMLYPTALTPEKEIYYQKQDIFAYVGEVESNFEPQITTVNPSGEGSLVMYRDSFGNAILPFFANTYENAYFSRGVPYQMTDLAAHEADTVIVERAERFLPEVAENPPVMEGSLMLIEEEGQPQPASVTDMKATQQGLYVKLEGIIEEQALETDSRICIRINDVDAYEAFPVTIQQNDMQRDGGFVLYLTAENWLAGTEKVEVLIQRDGKWISIYDTIL